MKKTILSILIAALLCNCSQLYAGGMRYLNESEFSQYDEMLKEKGQPDLKTVVAVYDDSFNPPRTGLKCVNKNGQQFQVYIIGSKITKVVKIK